MSLNFKVHGLTREEQGKYGFLSPRGTRHHTNRVIAEDVARREVIGKDDFPKADRRARQEAVRFVLAYGGNN